MILRSLLAVLLVLALVGSGCPATLSPPPPPAPPAPPPPLPAVSLVRQALGPSQRPPPNADLYLYLLIGSHRADVKKVLGAFNAYLCEVPPRPEGPLAGKTGLYIVPVLTDADASHGYARGEASRLSEQYDYNRAHQMLLELVQNNTMRPSDLIATGIYFAALDRAIPQQPLHYAIFEISRLRTDQDIQNWLVAEQQSIELGQQQSSRTPTDVPPSPLMILEGLGDIVAELVHISGTANAATIPCT
jgi:hypothetical protein